MFPRAGMNIPSEKAAGDSLPVLLALTAARKGKMRSRARKKTKFKGGSRGENQLVLKRTVPAAFACVARDLFSIYFSVFVGYRRAEQRPCWLRRVPNPGAGRARNPGCAGRAGAPSPEAAAGFVCEGKQNFNELCFHSLGLET